MNKLTYFLGWLLIKIKNLVYMMNSNYNTQAINNKGGYISGQTTIAYPNNIFMGKGSSINGGQLRASKNAKIIIGDNTIISYNVHIRTDMHLYDKLDVPIKKQGVRESDISIGNDVWIGFGAQIMSGVSIEDGAIIAAGAIVTKNVRKNEIVAGIPARKVKIRGEKIEK